MYAPLFLEFSEMVASNMYLLPQAIGPLKEILPDGLSQETARDNPEFTVGPMVDQKDILSPRVNSFLKIPCLNNFKFKKIKEIFVQSQYSQLVRFLLLMPFGGVVELEPTRLHEDSGLQGISGANLVLL